MCMRIFILYAVLQPLSGVTHSLKCPLIESGWKIREKSFICKEGHGLRYHCLLDLSGRPVEVCIERREYQREGCPWVLQTDEGNFLGEPLTPCPNGQYCPTKDTHFYSDQLYLHPACLVKEEERLNFTLPDISYDHQSSSSNDSLHHICHRDGCDYRTQYFAILGLYIFTVFILIIFIIACILQRRIVLQTENVEDEHIRRRSPVQNEKKESQLETSSDYYGNEGDGDNKRELLEQDKEQSQLETLPEYFVLQTENVEDEHIRRRSPVHNEKKESQLETSSDYYDVLGIEDIKRGLLEKNIEEQLALATLLDDSDDIGDDDIEKELLEQNTEKEPPLETLSDDFGLPLLDKKHEYEKNGNDDRQNFEEELKKLKQGCDRNITADDLKKVISLWVEMNDIQNHMTVLEGNCCLEIVDHYELRTSPPFYLDRNQREKIDEYMLQEYIYDKANMCKLILHYCVLKDSKQLAVKIIERNRSLLNNPDYIERSAFDFAIMLHKPDFAEFLLEIGANIHDEKYKPYNVLKECVMHRWTNLLRKILFGIREHQIEFSERGKAIQSVLSSCNEENMHAIGVALDIFPDMLLNIDYYSGDHAFIWAVKEKKQEVGMYILQNMSSYELCSAKECERLSALHVGIECHFLVQMILEKDEDRLLLNKIDGQSNTPLMYAALCKSKFYFDMLLQQPGLIVTNTNNDGRNILHILVENNWHDKCDDILRGRDSVGNKFINESIKSTLLKGQDIYGMTPLIYAVYKFSDIEMIQLLVDEGSELLQMDKLYKTVFDHLIDKYCENVIDTWTEYARVLMGSEKIRKMNYSFFGVKDGKGQSLSLIAYEKGCLQLLEKYKTQRLNNN